MTAANRKSATIAPKGGATRSDVKGVLRAALALCFRTAIFLVAWELAVRWLAIPHYLLPSPVAVAIAFVDKYDYLLANAAVTALEIGLGFVLGSLFGALVAIAMSLHGTVRRFGMPSVVITQAIPVYAIAPLLVLWLGFGMASKIVMAMLIVFFPVTSAFYDGLTRTDPDLIDLARLNGAGRWRTLWLVRVPAALPALSSGLRVSAVFAPIGAIVGEWVGSSAGLGHLMLKALPQLKVDLVFAALMILVAMVLGLRFAVVAATRALVPWQPEQADPTSNRSDTRTS